MNSLDIFLPYELTDKIYKQLHNLNMRDLKTDIYRYFHKKERGLFFPFEIGLFNHYIYFNNLD